MPLQNRVTPDGEIVAHASRGLLMGNRGGLLHTPQRTLANRRWASKRWICCRLAFNGRHRQVMAPGRYTELFFLDEATALAAGHRPCMECRRRDGLEFAALWARAHNLHDSPRVTTIDDALHQQRLNGTGRKRTYLSGIGALADGTIVRKGDGAYLVLGGHLQLWSPEGYGAPIEVRDDTAFEVLTPPGIVSVLRLGFRPTLHESAAVAD